MIIGFVIGLGVGLAVGIIGYLVARQEWQNELKAADKGCGFWQMNSLELVQYNAALEHRNRELEREQVANVPAVDALPVWVDPGGNVWFGS